MVNGFVNVAAMPLRGCENFNPLPFRASCKSTLQARRLALRIDLLDTKHSCVETLAHIGVVESHHNSCYFYQDLHNRPVQTASQQSFNPTCSPHYSLVHNTHTNGGTSAKSLNAIHFRYPSIRLVSCYTLLRGYRLPWPPY